MYDIEQDTWHLSPALIEPKINKRRHVSACWVKDWIYAIGFQNHMEAGELVQCTHEGKFSGIQRLHAEVAAQHQLDGLP